MPQPSNRDTPRLGISACAHTASPDKGTPAKLANSSPNLASQFSEVRAGGRWLSARAPGKAGPKLKGKVKGSLSEYGSEPQQSPVTMRSPGSRGFGSRQTIAATSSRTGHCTCQPKGCRRESYLRSQTLLGAPSRASLLAMVGASPARAPIHPLSEARCVDRQPQSLRNSTWFRIVATVAVARRCKRRRSCSPTENRCCGARIIPACSRPAPTHCV